MARSELWKVSFRGRRKWARASSSCPKEEDGDVVCSVELAKSTQDPTFPRFFLILTLF